VNVFVRRKRAGSMESIPGFAFCRDCQRLFVLNSLQDASLDARIVVQKRA
jgi:hypothetical protein